MDIKPFTCFISLCYLLLLIYAQDPEIPRNLAATLETDDGSKKCTTQLRTCKLKIEDLDFIPKQGVIGEKGNQGLPGFNGLPGEKGEQGSIGPPGVPGTIGEQGLKGDKGDNGRDGLNGFFGEKGEPGIKGEQINNISGDIGPSGRPGLVGIQGLQGARGDIGPTGLTGLPGSPGQIGMPGPQGLPGPQGPKGPYGNPGIKGEKGEMGLAGLIGPQGNPGEKGNSGENGHPGLPGSPGPSGPPGLAGLPGVCPCVAPDVPYVNAETADTEFGTKLNPGKTTCKSAAIIESGPYFLQPEDLFQIYCNMTSNLTCLFPSNLTHADIESKAITYKDTKKPFWTSELYSFDIKNIYGLSKQNILWLQERSESVTQTLRYHCQNSVPYYKNNATNHLKLLTWNDVVVGPQPSDSIPLYYSIPPETNGCGDTEGYPEWKHADIVITSNNVRRLPIVDILINDVREEENQSYYIEHVALCFG